MRSKRLTYIEPMRNADGSVMTYKQRAAVYKAAADEKRQAEKQAKADAEAKHREKVSAVGYVPPSPEPRLTYDQRTQVLRKEALGRAKAEAAAEAAAEANAPPENPYRKIIAECERTIYKPESRRRLERMQALADRWDADRERERITAEKQAAIDADPSVQNARSYAAGLLKLAPEEFKAEAAEINGIAQAGNSALAFERMKALDERIFQHWDRVAAEKRAAKAVTDAEFQNAASTAEAARVAAETSARTAAELNPAE